MLIRFKSVLMVAVAGLALVTVPGRTQAAVILNFSQDGAGSPIVGTNNGAGQTTISTAGTAVTISGIAPSSGLSTPIAAFLTLDTVSTNAASIDGNMNIQQKFAGTLKISQNADGTGINYLSAIFTDSVFGAGTSLTLSASDADGISTVIFASDVIPGVDLGFPRGIALSFAAVNPAASIDNGSLASFTSSVAGTFSAEPIPEPATVVSLLTGVALAGGVTALRRRRQA